MLSLLMLTMNQCLQIRSVQSVLELYRHARYECRRKSEIADMVLMKDEACVGRAVRGAVGGEGLILCVVLAGFC
jgi:hypothetical protein